VADGDAAGDSLAVGDGVVEADESGPVLRAAGSPALDPQPVRINTAILAGMPHARTTGEGT
jgi:hypothetical protein